MVDGKIHDVWSLEEQETTTGPVDYLWNEDFRNGDADSCSDKVWTRNVQGLLLSAPMSVVSRRRGSPALGPMLQWRSRTQQLERLEHCVSRKFTDSFIR